MSIGKKIANRGYENEAYFTTRDVSHHGMSKARRQVKKLRNRAAKFQEEQIDFNDWE